MENQQLIQTLNECTTACYHCSVSCLEEDDVKKMARCIRLDLDCAGACSYSAELAARNSDLLAKQLEVCAEICRQCAEECEQHASKMEHCKVCAEACRKCEEACLSVA